VGTASDVANLALDDANEEAVAEAAAAAAAWAGAAAGAGSMGALAEAMGVFAEGRTAAAAAGAAEAAAAAGSAAEATAAAGPGSPALGGAGDTAVAAAGANAPGRERAAAALTKRREQRSDVSGVVSGVVTTVEVTRNGQFTCPVGRACDIYPATSSRIISNPRFLSETQSYDVASNSWQALGVGCGAVFLSDGPPPDAWHYRSPSGTLQGPFKLASLREGLLNTTRPRDVIVWREAGGLLRTSIRPTLNLLLLLRTSA
jgi:hypothetical protein